MNNLNSNKVIFSKSVKTELNAICSKYSSDKIFLLADENTLKYCLPIVKDALPKKVNFIIIKSGEGNKNLETLQYIWEFLQDNFADRKSLLINLGGGVITDMGGFAALTFKRGIDFVNIPTTLLSQIDASVGGKTGVNFLGLKNQIGIIKEANKVIIDPIFLKTLSQNDILSGFAEMLKHALISNENHFHELISYISLGNYNLSSDLFFSFIKKSVNIKYNIIKKDINEKGLRKVLNFGHTFGHVFESMALSSGKPISHGEAVAHGIICELFLSNQKKGLNIKNLLDISEKISNLYINFKINKNDSTAIKELMLHDKKNENNKINCVLLSKIAKPIIDNHITESEIDEALFFHRQLSK